MGELGKWGVVGQGGVSSLPAKMEVVELRGSNMADSVFGPSYSTRFGQNKPSIKFNRSSPSSNLVWS